MKTSIIIPARFKSSRFPGKPLKKILGIPLVIRVALISEKAVGKKNVYIATDSTIYVRFILNAIYNCKDYFVWLNQSEMNLSIKAYFDIETKYYKKAINSQRKPSLFILRKL